jgi:hypothetical protein
MVAIFSNGAANEYDDSDLWDAIEELNADIEQLRTVLE